MDDLISRQAAIAHAISGRTRELEGEKWIRVSEVRESLQTMPSAERHGRWVLITEDGIATAEFLCSVCGRKISHSGVKDMVSIHYPYCHCGAKMDEVEE